MNLRIGLITFLSLPVFSASLFANDAPIPLAISGMGTDSCASYVLALNENRPTAGIRMDGKNYLTEAGAYTQWVVGFVNAIRWVQASGGTYSLSKKAVIRPLSVDVNAIALAVKKICERNPEYAIGAAAITYVTGLPKQPD